MKAPRLLLIHSIVFITFSVLSVSPASADNSAVIPAPRSEDWALAQHKAIVSTLKTSDLRLIFLGDSISHELEFGPPPIGSREFWDANYAQLNAAAFSCPGDKTQNVLWRIGEGKELSGLNPTVVVLQIGRNNLISQENTPDETAAGIQAIVKSVREQLPNAKILILGILPFGQEASIAQTNSIISKLADSKQIYYLDVGKKFIGSDGSVSPEVQDNGNLLSKTGCQIYTDALRPYLDDLMKNDGQGALWQKQ